MTLWSAWLVALPESAAVPAGRATEDALRNTV